MGYYLHHVRALHAPMILSRGLRGLGDALPISLTIDTPYQVVGGKPKFTLIGAQPGATIYWSSFKDNQATAEYNASYGQTVGANGTAVLEGGAWTAADAGRWSKEILIQTPDGQNVRAKVDFIVSDPAASTGTGSTSSSSSAGNFLTQTFQVAGQDIPYWIPIAGVGAYLLFGRRR